MTEIKPGDIYMFTDSTRVKLSVTSIIKETEEAWCRLNSGAKMPFTFEDIFMMLEQGVIKKIYPIVIENWRDEL